MGSVGDLLVDTLTDAITFVCAALTGHFDVENVRHIAANAKVVLDIILKKRLSTIHVDLCQEGKVGQSKLMSIEVGF